jgi:hypothetical protein
MAVGKKANRVLDKLRPLIFERDGGCVVAGSLWDLLERCSGDLTLQHRAPRGMGGNSDDFNAPENLLAMCLNHNRLERDSVPFRDFCRRSGYAMPRWVIEGHNGLDAGMVPVRFADGWHMVEGLDRREISEATALAFMASLYGEPTE